MKLEHYEGKKKRTSELPPPNHFKLTITYSDFRKIHPEQFNRLAKVWSNPKLVTSEKLLVLAQLARLCEEYDHAEEARKIKVVGR